MTKIYLLTDEDIQKLLDKIKEDQRFSSPSILNEHDQRIYEEVHIGS